MKRAIQAAVLVLTFLTCAGAGYGWSCLTHILIAREAGMKNPEYACIPDVSRSENPDLLGPFHYHNAPPGTTVTPGYIDAFGVEERGVTLPGEDARTVTLLVPHRAGVLYGKIVALYRIMRNPRYPTDYHYALMNIAHFIGDLSQPLHNYPRGTVPASDGKVYEDEGAWAKDIHAAFDDALDKEPFNSGDFRYLRRKIAVFSIRDEEDLKRRISDIANSANSLANQCFKENRRMMTQREALDQAAMSASLLKAVMASAGK